MHRDPARLAWTVLLTSFVIFCMLVVSVPLGLQWYVENALESKEARVTCLEGTAIVENTARGTITPVLKGQTLSVTEGSVLILDETAQAVLNLFDQSFVRVFSGTRVSMEQMRTPRFGRSSRPPEITLSVKGGRIYVSTVPHASQPVLFTVESLQAVTSLAEDGAYALEVSNESTEVIVQRGVAVVSSASTAVPAEASRVTLNARQRTVVDIGEAPLAALKAERDLVSNGDFRAPLASGWLAFNDQGADGGVVDGQVSLLVDEGRRAVRFLRTNGEYNHCESIIEQELSRDLQDPLSVLKVRAMIKVSEQSLSGGGYLSSEYPLMIRVRYQDMYSSENEWVKGFYYQNTSGNPTANGQEIPQGKWYLYESANLLDTLPIVPRRILWLRVYASGWSYESYVSEVSIIVE
jgi:hypothetical protein